MAQLLTCDITSMSRISLLHKTEGKALGRVLITWYPTSSDALIWDLADILITDIFRPILAQ